MCASLACNVKRPQVQAQVQSHGSLGHTYLQVRAPKFGRKPDTPTVDSPETRSRPTLINGLLIRIRASEQARNSMSRISLGRARSVGSLTSTRCFPNYDYKQNHRLDSRHRMIQVCPSGPLRRTYPLPYRGAFSHFLGTWTCGKWEQTPLI